LFIFFTYFLHVSATDKFAFDMDDANQEHAILGFKRHQEEESSQIISYERR